LYTVAVLLVTQSLQRHCRFMEWLLCLSTQIQTTVISSL